MGFSNQERINANTNALQANVLDANPSSQWYEKRFTFEFALPSSKVYTQLSSIPSASSLTEARTNATNNPTLIEDLSQSSSAIRLTAVTGTNDFTYVAYSTFGDTSSARKDNWLQPQAIPQSTGIPSNGYSISLYNGDPNSGGTLITTTDGQTGSGTTASVGWIWNYALGMLLLSQDFFTETGITKATFDPYVVGFRYIGQTAGTAADTDQVIVDFVADETISSGDLVRFATSADAGTAGRVLKTNASSYDNSVAIGVSKQSGNQGDTISVVTNGRVGVNFTSPPATTFNGQKVFVSTVNGQATTTPPSGTNAIAVIGRLYGADGSSSNPNVLLNFEDPIAQ